MAELLRGAPAAAALTDTLIPRCGELLKRGITPTLAIVRLGARDDDRAYETAAIRRCEKIGIRVKPYLLSESTTTAALLAVIDEINADASIHGCLIFRPLPDAAMEEAACARLAPEKDVDGMTRASQAYVYSGKGLGFSPCTAEACVRLLEHYGYDLTGKHVVVLGRSRVVGRPLFMLLLQKNATVTVCHSRSVNEQAISRTADIVVAAVGKPEHVDASYFHSGQIVVDVGIHERADGTLCGDVSAAAAEDVAAYSPVPGGVGNLTTSILAEHVLIACEKSLAIPVNQ